MSLESIHVASPHSAKQRSVQRRLFVAVVLPMIVLVLLATSFLSLVVYGRAITDTACSDAVIGTAITLTLLVDQETGLREYLPASEINFLASYEWADPPINRTLNHFMNRTGTDCAAFSATEAAIRDKRDDHVAIVTSLVIVASLMASVLLGIALVLLSRRVVQAASKERDAAPATNRMQASEIQPSAAHFEALFDHSPLGILLVRDGMVQAANRASVALFGYNHANLLLGRPWFRLIDPADHEALGAYLAQLSEPSETEGITITGIRANNTTFPIRVHVAQIQLHDGVAQVAYITDQTVQRQLEQQVLRMQKLESVGRLAGGIAHDFNNLLTVITSAVDLAESTLIANRTALADLTLIRQTVERGSALTRQLLAVASRQPSHPATIDLNELIRKLQPLLHLLVGRQVDLQTTTSATLWPIEADSTQIEQVLLNLVVNARDATPSGGSITIETENIVLDANSSQYDLAIPSGRYVRIAVRDTGSGMSAEVQARLFEPFFTTKGPDQGTGLGLATSYGIILQHRGYILVTSEPGHGTTFEILLPPATVSHEVRAIGV